MPGYILILFLFSLLFAGPTTAQTTPHEDTGFTAVTPRPDPDFVVVRERAYGAEGVDLTPYGIGSGPVDYVQSIYLRLYVDSEPVTVDAFLGRIVLPSSVQVIGIITDKTELGGSEDDGLATETDAIFGIGTDPDAYSSQSRGLEPGGDRGTSEFVQLFPDDNAIVFGFNVERGVDDLRIIVDYGDSFPTDVAFDLRFYLQGRLGGAAPGTGIIIGATSEPPVVGSGDFDEVEGLVGIPLTALDEPVAADAIPFDAFANVFIARDIGNGDTGRLDGFDLTLGLPAPGIIEFSVDTPELLEPVALTDDNGGLIYVLARDFGLVVSDPAAGTYTEHVLAPRNGFAVDITNARGTRDLFVLRIQEGDDAYVDRLGPDGLVWLDEIVIPAADLPDPVGITDTPDGRLCVADRSGAMGIVDPVARTVSVQTVALPGGTWVDLTGFDTNDVYVLRRVAIDDYRIDVFDVAMQQITTFGLVFIPLVADAVALSDAPGKLLQVVGAGDNMPATLLTVDPAFAAVIAEFIYVNFSGVNVSVTNLNPPLTAVTDPDLGAFPALLRHGAAPNPFNPRVGIHFELEKEALVRVAIYDIKGRLVRTLSNGPREAGRHEIGWDGRDRTGRNVPSGPYLYRVEAGAQSGTGKITLAR